MPISEMRVSGLPILWSIITNIEFCPSTDSSLVPALGFVFEDNFNLGDFILFSIEFKLLVGEIGFYVLFPAREVGFDFGIKNL
jgi:hypothetical protein